MKQRFLPNGRYRCRWLTFRNWQVKFIGGSVGLRSRRASGWIWTFVSRCHRTRCRLSLMIDRKHGVFQRLVSNSFLLIFWLFRRCDIEAVNGRYVGVFATAVWSVTARSGHTMLDSVRQRQNVTLLTTRTWNLVAHYFRCSDCRRSIAEWARIGIRLQDYQMLTLYWSKTSAMLWHLIWDGGFGMADNAYWSHMLPKHAKVVLGFTG